MATINRIVEWEQHLNQMSSDHKLPPLLALSSQLNLRATHMRRHALHQALSRASIQSLTNTPPCHCSSGCSLC